MLEFSDYMYGNINFAKAIHSALREGGILGGQVGIERQRTVYDDHDWIRLINNLERVGFFVLHDYMESGCGFDDAWKFFIAPSDRHGLSRWFNGEAMTDLDIAHRTVLTKSGDGALKFLDGATMASYQTPTRKAENTYCAYLSTKGEGYGCVERLDSERQNIPTSKFEIRTATNPSIGRGIFAVEDIPAHVYLGIDEVVHSMLVMPDTVRLIERMYDLNDYVEELYFYVHGYGMETFPYGETSLFIDPGIMTFVNHGCNGTYHTDNILPVTEVNAQVDELPKVLRRRFYDPARHRQNWLTYAIDALEKPVPAGTEMFDNYLYISEGASLFSWKGK